MSCIGLDLDSSQLDICTAIWQLLARLLIQKEIYKYACMNPEIHLATDEQQRKMTKL